MERHEITAFLWLFNQNVFRFFFFGLLLFCSAGWMELSVFASDYRQLPWKQAFIEKLVWGYSERRLIRPTFLLVFILASRPLLMRSKYSYNACVCAGTSTENVRTYQVWHRAYWKNLLRGKYHLDGKLTSNLFPHISAVIDLSKGTIKKISPQLHGTDAKKRREKPFNQYFIDQFAVFCQTLIKKSLSTEVY